MPPFCLRHFAALSAAFWSTPPSGAVGVGMCRNFRKPCKIYSNVRNTLGMGLPWYVSYLLSRIKYLKWPPFCSSPPIRTLATSHFASPFIIKRLMCNKVLKLSPPSSISKSPRRKGSSDQESSILNN